MSVCLSSAIRYEYMRAHLGQPDEMHRVVLIADAHIFAFQLKRAFPQHVKKHHAQITASVDCCPLCQLTRWPTDQGPQNLFVIENGCDSFGIVMSFPSTAA